MAGFALFFATGYFVTFGSFKDFIGLMEGNPVPFVLTYSLGNLCSLLASLFLVEPHRQLANMFDETRKVTTIVFLASLFLVLVLVLCFVNMENIFKLTLLVTLAAGPVLCVALIFPVLHPLRAEYCGEDRPGKVRLRRRVLCVDLLKHAPRGPSYYYKLLQKPYMLLR